MKLVSVPSLLLALIPIACNAPANNKDVGSDIKLRKPYTLPSTLVLNAHADRTQDGSIVISGTTNLPDGLKLWVEIESGHLPLGAPKVVASDEAVIVKEGLFKSNSLLMEVPNKSFAKSGWPKSVRVDIREKPFVPGPAKIHFESYFNGAWQTKDVLALLGNDEGKSLHGPILQSTDPDVVDSGKTVDYRQLIVFPPISSEAKAINLVRESVLSIAGEGGSAGDVQANIDLYLTAPGLSSGTGWTAKSITSSEFQVDYDFINGAEGHKQAIWIVNIVTGSVKYVNENAKLFSWTPKN